MDRVGTIRPKAEKEEAEFKATASPPPLLDPLQKSEPLIRKGETIERHPTTAVG